MVLVCADPRGLWLPGTQAEAIRIYTASKQLGKDAELSAAEIVRRAERGIGIAIRRGQEAGEIRKIGHRRDGSEDTRLPPDHYFSHPKERTDIYAITDGIGEEEFDAAIETARSEGNLTRANVLRKVKGEPAKPKPQPDTAPPSRKRRPDGSYPLVGCRGDPELAGDDAGGFALVLVGGRQRCWLPLR